MKCFIFINHKWSKWGKPFIVYGSHWYQIRKCDTCGAIQKRDIGFIQADKLEY
jgi:hypothetical protein